MGLRTRRRVQFMGRRHTALRLGSCSEASWSSIRTGRQGVLVWRCTTGYGARPMQREAFYPWQHSVRPATRTLGCLCAARLRGLKRGDAERQKFCSKPFAARRSHLQLYAVWQAIVGRQDEDRRGCVSSANIRTRRESTAVYCRREHI